MVAIISLLFGGIEFVLALRFVFFIFGANPATPFVEWIYNTSDIFVAPFVGIFGQPHTALMGTVVHSVFDASTLVALVVYGAIGGIIVGFFSHGTGLNIINNR